MSKTETKLAPHTQESEMMVLGCMLTSYSSLNIGAEALDDTDFYFAEHRIIFQVLKAAYRSDQPADVHLISEELKRQDKLKAVGGVGYLTTLAQYAGTSCYVEEYIEIVRNKSILRRLLHVAQNAERQVLKDPEDVQALLDDLKEKILNIEQSAKFEQLPVVTMVTRLESLDEKLKKLRGKKFLGLCQKTIPAIDENLLGLRKLILLAAAPNVGKTALSIQLAIDVLKTHQEACLIYFSLEMQESDIFTRMFCNLMQMDYKTFVLGSGTNNREEDSSAHHSLEELATIEKAKSKLKEIGNRIQIVDSSRISSLSSKKAIAFINEVKEKTGTTRAIVIIDYLQVWPTPDGKRFSSEIEIDKWRIEEVKRIRDAVNDDPVIVISEARKPQSDCKWGGDLSDVMGTARSTYSPDAVFLFSELNLNDIESLWPTDGRVCKYKKNSTGKNQQKPGDGDVEKFCDYLERNEISLCRLDMPKGRDGMQKFSILLEFHYKKNIFKTANFSKIKADSKKSADKP